MTYPKRCYWTRRRRVAWTPKTGRGQPGRTQVDVAASVRDARGWCRQGCSYTASVTCLMSRAALGTHEAFVIEDADHMLMARSNGITICIGFWRLPTEWFARRDEKSSLRPICRTYATW